MFLREAPTKTLRDLREEFTTVTEGETVVCTNGDIKVDLTNEKTVTFGEAGHHTLPVTPTAMSTMADWIGVPAKFLLRQDPDLQEIILNRMFGGDGLSPVMVRFNEGSVIDLLAPDTKVINPQSVIDVASKVLGNDAVVVESWIDSREYRFDAIVPTQDFGDRQVGDITRAGLRFGQDTQHNLSPWVQRYMYRLVCTNGMETFDSGLKVDGRGQSVEDVLMELELMAQRAFGTIEREIEAFYALREQPVPENNPERFLNRLAEETGMGAPVLARLIREAPAILGPEPTMFDMVNYVTNQANDPDIVGRANIRRALERSGGHIVADADGARCGTCFSLLDGHSH